MLEIELVKKIKANISQKEVDRVGQKVAGQLKIKKQLEVSLALVSDREIKRLNQRYRGQDRVTDVLSFEITKEDFILPPSQKYLGEIVISYPQTQRQAKQNKCSVKKEFFLLLIHGLLHLLGYDHEKNKRQAREMEEWQQKILTKLGF